MSVSITNQKREMLLFMLEHEWISTRDVDDRTMNQLRENGFVRHDNHPDKPYWVLTQSGLTMARRLRDG